ncbi:hypothetical protein I7F96_28810 [Sinorhizobium meliloti]|uniref:hypothetical protein n=1 Tax=Rhizobium meliloti TaxID=382 RepID=UPI0013E36C45|nr:hypothetical protein [Sinorhizobium meliloti]MDE3774820.1 hypothetical protein [Sinorhizobium meliloti]
MPTEGGRSQQSAPCVREADARVGDREGLQIALRHAKISKGQAVVFIAMSHLKIEFTPGYINVKAI